MSEKPLSQELEDMAQKLSAFWQRLLAIQQKDLEQGETDVQTEPA